jgi:repressor LexA
MLKVRGDSMIGAGILDGDYVVVRHQPDANDGEIVVAGINDDEATVKTLRRQGNTVILVPANDAMAPIEMPSDEVVIYGKVISVLRRL